VTASDHPLLFGTADQLLTGSGPLHTSVFPRSDSAEWTDSVLAYLSGASSASGSRQVAFGALSFRPDAPAFVHFPSSVVETGSAEAMPILEPASAAERRDVQVNARPAGASYGSVVSVALERLGPAEPLRKVVLGRWLDVTADRPLSSRRILSELAARNPAGLLFCLPIPQEIPDAGGRADAVLLGASPELLLSRRGRTVRSVPLAGSIPRTGDPVEDRRRAEALLESAKDQDEHRYVVDALAAVLGPLCDDFRLPESPSILATDSMLHLASPITGRLTGATADLPSALRLAQLLHPTPAVCGTPTTLARDTIAELEIRDRGLLTGAVGWVDANGDGEWAVTIRAGVLTGERAALFAAAGITGGSVPASEVAETDAKLQTMLLAIR
jgi:isochorismate synthase